jgi:phosphoglycolate phosphatase
MARIIFDFDGTLANTLSVALEVANAMQFTKPLTLDDYYRLRNLPTLGILKALNIPVWRVPSLMNKARVLLRQQAHKITPNAGIEQLIPQLTKDGHQLYVLSSNSPELVSAFLLRYKLDMHFELVVGNVGIFGKTAALKKLKKSLQTDDAVYYVGDETRDIDAAKKAHLPIISVTWGYNGAEVLTTHNPDYLVQTANEIRQIAKGKA